MWKCADEGLFVILSPPRQAKDLSAMRQQPTRPFTLLAG